MSVARPHILGQTEGGAAVWLRDNEDLVDTVTVDHWSAKTMIEIYKQEDDWFWVLFNCVPATVCSGEPEWLSTTSR